MGSVIKHRQTGFIVFAARMFSVVTSLAFLVMVTRWLSPSQLGLWEFILDLVIFSSFPVGLFTYWATREVARGAVIGRTTQVLSLLMSTVGVALYVLFALVTHTVVGSVLTPFLLALVLVPLNYWVLSTQAVVIGHNPAAMAYATFFSEAAKLAVAYPLLYSFRLGIDGVILSIAISYLVKAAASTLFLGDAARDPVVLSKGKEWLRYYHVPALYTFTSVLLIADTLVASLGQGGTSLAGFYQAAFQVASVITYSASLSVALYPLLLRKSSERLSGEILEFTLLFGVPMTAGLVVMAPKVLYLLQPVYVQSTMALVLLSLAGLVTLLSTVLDMSLMGREDADLRTADKSRSILRSDLFFVSAANIGYSAVYLSTIFLLAWSSTTSGLPPPLLAAYWALAQLVLTSALVPVKLRRLLKKSRLVLTRSTAFITASSLVMGLVLFVVQDTALPSGLDTLAYGSRLGLLVVLGGAFYFGLLLALDAQFRSLFRAVASAFGLRRRKASAD